MADIAVDAIALEGELDSSQEEAMANVMDLLQKNQPPEALTANLRPVITEILTETDFGYKVRAIASLAGGERKKGERGGGGLQ